MTTRRWTTAFTTLALAAGLQAADAPPKLPLDQLLETPISTAAKYDQQMSSVAASVTVVTAEEIERYGWTSLDQVLQAVRGFYITRDRDYTFIGVRGIGLPSNYNHQLLILIDGQPVNDTIFGNAPAGHDLALDMSMVEKVEIVRGPGSALYGTHAMLAVINLITKRADALDDLTLSLSEGSGRTARGALRTGKVFANGTRLTASGYWQESNGDTLYFPEFDTPETNDGITRGNDYLDVHRFALALERGGLRLAFSTRSSVKGMPSAKYDTVFGADEHAVNAQDVISAEYSRAFGNKKIEARAFWDRDRYRGHFQYDVVGVDRSFAINRGGEARILWDIRPNHRLTGGVEYVSSAHVRYTYDVGDYSLNLHRPYDTTSMYAEYEAHLSTKVAVVAGFRRDSFSATADSTSPRAAILFTPNASTTLKLLYGSAFRSPNIYESFYNDPVIPWKANPNLKPETIDTTELVWEQRLSPDLLLLASAFHIRGSNLIDQQLEPAERIYWYNNIGSLQSTGIELGVHMRLVNGLWAHVGASTQHTESDGGPAINSPRYMVKTRLSTSPWGAWHGAVEAMVASGRRTRDGGSTAGFMLMNGNVSRQLGRNFRLTLTARNLLDVRYSTPVGPELRAQSIAQDGRTFTLKLTYAR